MQSPKHPVVPVQEASHFISAGTVRSCPHEKLERTGSFTKVSVLVCRDIFVHYGL